MFHQVLNILIKNKFREPLELIWNICLPSIFFLMTNWQWRGNKVGFMGMVSHMELFIGWAIAISSLYGVGMLCTFWRDQGVLDLFVQSRLSRWRLVKALFFYQCLANILVLAVMLICGFFVFQIEGDKRFIELACSVVLGGLIVSWGSLVIPAMGKDSAQMSTYLSIGVVFFVWVVPQAQESPFGGFLNALSPIYLVIAIQRALLNNHLSLDYASYGSLILHLSLGAYGFRSLLKSQDAKL